MKIMHFPLARLTILFVCGIVIARTISSPGLIPIMGLASMLVLFAVYMLSRKYDRIQLGFGIASAVCAVLLGFSTQQLHSDSNRANHYLNFAHDHEFNSLELVLREQFKTTAKNERFVATVQTINGRSSQGLLLLNIKKDSLAQPLVIGSVINLQSNFGGYQPPRNPGQFDYAGYLKNKNIASQIYCSRNEMLICDKVHKNVWYYAAKIRNTMLTNLRLSGFKERELNVLAALILGQQQDIAREILRDYQYAGAVHILSVSGLHVGLILLFINIIMRPLPNTRTGSLFKIVILLGSLWCFAILAGLSPSVVRSVTMFSFVAIGMHLRRSTNIFHTLLVSVFLILLFQPSFLMDVGFQLSYVALFFIVWLQPLFASLWQPKNTIVKYLWDIVTVSFAAQIGTFPLSVYYFHQFAGLFFVTNLLIIPFLSVIMAIGVTVAIIAMFGTVPFGLALVLEKCIFILNGIIAKIASFDQFVLRDIPFNKVMLVSSYLLIIAFFIWIGKPNFRRLCYVMLLVMAVQASCLQAMINSRNHSELIVFNLPRNTLLAENRNANAKIFCNDTSFHSNSMLQSFLVGNFITTHTIENVPNVMHWKNKNILIIDSLAVVPSNKYPDVILLIQSPRINLERLLKNSKPEIIIADASNYKSYIENWKRTCHKQKIPFHATGEKGFYSIK